MEYKHNNYLRPILYATLCLGTRLYAGGLETGINEEGFVAPPQDRKLPPAPPRSVSSAETLMAYCCCPVTPMAQSEAKKPPRPPVAVTKIQH